MDDKNTVKLSFNTDVEQLKKELHRSLGFFKSFVNTFNKTLAKIGDIPGVKTSNLSPAETVKKETKGLLKNPKSILNPSYGIFDEESGLYSGGKYRTNAVQIEEANKRLANSFTELKIVGVYAFRALSRSFKNIIKEMSIAGAELYELNSRFGLIFGEMTSNAENFANKLGEAYGLNEATIKNNMLKLYTLGQNAGLANDQALELTKTMSRLGVEVASVWDVPIEQATDNLISALQGLPRAMKKYGSYLGTTEIKEFLNQYREQQGLEPITRELTRQEKTLGVYLKSLSDLGYSFGDFERTVTSTANQMRIMQETITTLKQVGGQLLNETLSPLLQFGNGILKVVSKLSKSILKMPTGFKFVVSALMLLVLTLPMIAGTGTLFIYYTTKMKVSLESLSGALATSSKRFLSWSKVVKSTAKWAGLIGGLIMSVQMVKDAFSKTGKDSDNVTKSFEAQQNAAKSLKRTLSSFDDVNVFKTNESDSDSLFGDLNINEFLESVGLASDELSNLNGLFEETTNWAKGLSIAFLAINLITLIHQFSKLSSITRGFSVFLASAVLVVAQFMTYFDKFAYMTNFERIINGLMGVAAAALTVAAGFAAMKGRYGLATGLGLAAAGLAIGGLAWLSSINKPEETTANNVGSKSSVVDSAYNPNDANSSLGANISSAVTASMAGFNGNNKPVNVNVNVHVDEEYIYKAYNNVAKQNGVM